MEIILKKNVDGLGKAYEIVKVKKGYARNYLFPNDLAKQANKANIKELKKYRIVLERKQDRQKYLIQLLEDKLQEFKEQKKVIKFKERASDEGHLYGSVSNVKIVERLKQYGISLDKKYIIINKPIKSLGENIINIKIESSEYELPILVEKLEE